MFLIATRPAQTTTLNLKNLDQIVLTKIQGSKSLIGAEFKAGSSTLATDLPAHLTARQIHNVVARFCQGAGSGANVSVEEFVAALVNKYPAPASED